MTWVRHDDQLGDDPRIVTAGAILGAGVVALALSYSNRNLTDGWIPAAMLRRWLQQDGSTAVAEGAATERLLASGIVAVQDREGIPGYQLHADYVHLQPSREQVLKQRTTRSRQKAEAGRLGGLATKRARRQQPRSTTTAEVRQDTSRSAAPYPDPDPLNVRVLVLPCRPAAIRGLRCVIVVLDEIAHFRSTDNQPLDRETWRAALPTLLTTGGKLVALSSPYVASGLAYDLHAKHYGKDTDVLVWQSSALALHPGLSSVALDQIRDADPEGAEAEIEGHFLRHVSALHDESAIAAAVDVGVTVRPRQSLPAHHAHVDVATGAKATGDRWAAAVAHLDGGTAVLDALLVIHPPFSPETAAMQTANFVRGYGLGVVTGDRFAGGFSNEAFARAGVVLEPAPKSTSDLHLDFAAMLSSGRVRLLDHPGLLAELRGLERRRGATRDRVDHRVGVGQHDDIACAVAGAAVAAATRVEDPGPSCVVIMPDEWDAGSYFRR